MEENDDEDEHDKGDTNAGNTTQQNTTQRSTEADTTAEELRAAEDLRWAMNKMIEIDSDAGGETPPREDRSLGSASMDLEGSQPSEMEYH